MRHIEGTGRLVIDGQDLGDVDLHLFEVNPRVSAWDGTIRAHDRDLASPALRHSMGQGGTITIERDGGPPLLLMVVRHGTDGTLVKCIEAPI